MEGFLEGRSLPRHLPLGNEGIGDAVEEVDVAGIYEVVAGFSALQIISALPGIGVRFEADLHTDEPESPIRVQNKGFLHTELCAVWQRPPRGGPFQVVPRSGEP